MLKVIDYTTELERENAVKTMLATGAKLLEVQNHFDGNHLIFEIEDRNLITEMDTLKQTLIEKGIFTASEIKYTQK